MNGNRRRRSGGWLHLGFVVFLVIGIFTTAEATDNTPPAEQRQVERCHGTAYTEAEADSVQTLVDAGWHATGSMVYPPGCESVR